MAYNYKKTGVPVLEPFGNGVPFGDPLWYQGFASPYYGQKHVAWRKRCREFVETEILPFIDEWEAAGVLKK